MCLNLWEFYVYKYGSHLNVTGFLHSQLVFKKAEFSKGTTYLRNLHSSKHHTPCQLNNFINLFLNLLLTYRKCNLWVVWIELWRCHKYGTRIPRYALVVTSAHAHDMGPVSRGPTRGGVPLSLLSAYCKSLLQYPNILCAVFSVFVEACFQQFLQIQISPSELCNNLHLTIMSHA
jgi:hypothetical protein